VTATEFAAVVEVASKQAARRDTKGNIANEASGRTRYVERVEGVGFVKAKRARKEASLECTWGQGISGVGLPLPRQGGEEKRWRGAAAPEGVLASAAAEALCPDFGAFVPGFDPLGQTPILDKRT
jgi:hypothetical protein